MYDGTMTREDPNLVESFELDEQTTAYVVRDIDAEAPDWDGIGYVYAVNYVHDRYDSIIVAGDSGDASPLPVETIRDAYHRLGDPELVARYLRIFHEAVSVDYSTMIYSDANVYAVVTRAQAEAWGCPDELTPGLAAEALDVVRQWREGEVYGVIVVNSETGEEDSLWNVYDSSPNLDYCRTVAVDIAPIGVAP